MTEPNFNIYRCPDPVAQITKQPWYPYENICPCNPTDSNPTGRGFTPCPFGVQYNQDPPQSGLSTKSSLLGNLYASVQSKAQIAPPQFDPRQNTRIGQQWRNPY